MSVARVFQNIDLMMEGEIPYMFQEHNQQNKSNQEYGFIPELLSWVTGKTKIKTLTPPESAVDLMTDASGQSTERAGPFLQSLRSEFQ